MGQGRTGLSAGVPAWTERLQHAAAALLKRERDALSRRAGILIFPKYCRNPGGGDTLFRPAASPTPVSPGQFDRLHKNTGNNREKREAMKGKRLFFRRIRQINPTGGIGQNQVFQKFLSPPGASAEEKILLCSIQIRCLSDRPDLPQSMCLFHLSDTKAIADLSLAKTLRAGHTEGLMLCYTPFFGVNLLYLFDNSSLESASRTIDKSP